MKDHVEREFCSEKCKKPLGGIHVCFKADIQEVVVQVRNVFLKSKLISTGHICSYPIFLRRLINLPAVAQKVIYLCFSKPL